MKPPTRNSLQKASDKLISVDWTPRDMEIRGARPVFVKSVFHVEGLLTCLDELELNPQQETSEKVRRVLAEWADPKTHCYKILMSEHLPIHLNLPVKIYPADCWLFQALVLGKDLPFFLLTLFDGESADTVPELSVVRLFSTRCARVLTTHLQNFCGKDFILLHCTLEMKNFSSSTLQEELKCQEGLVAEVYSGPLSLKGDTLEKLEEAVLILATASDASPFFHVPGNPGRTLLKASQDSDRFLRQIILHLKSTGNTATPPTINYRATTLALSMVLEAAKRLSYSERVVIVSDDPKVKKYEQYLERCAKREHGIEPFRCLTMNEAREEFTKESSVDAPPGTTDVQHGPHEAAAPIKGAQMMTSPNHEWTINVKSQENGRASEDDNESEESENTQGRKTSMKSVPATEEKVLDNKAKLSAEDQRSFPSDDGLSLSDPVPHRSMETAPPPAAKYASATPDQGARYTVKPLLSQAAPGVLRPRDKNPLIIALDCPEFTYCPGLKLKLSNTEKPRPPRTVRLLLVGKSGSGKSSTGNSILGRKAFTAGTSFSPVTEQSQAQEQLIDDTLIKVVESPGIFDFTGSLQDEGLVDARETFDAVCFVVKIGRFTDEDSHTFDRLKKVYGESVCRHMVVIFTCGDNLSERRGDNFETLLNEAPDSLHDVMNRCDKRHVVFNNTRPNEDQVRKLLSLLQKLDGGGEKYVCPKKSVLQDRWNNARDADLERKRKLRKAA